MLMKQNVLESYHTSIMFPRSLLTLKICSEFFKREKSLFSWWSIANKYLEVFS